MFTFGCLGLCCCVWAFSSCSEWGLLSSCDVCASHYSGFSCCRAQALGVQASVVAARGLSSFDTWALLLRSIWDLPRPGVEHMFSALGGGLLTSGPPEKPKNLFQLNIKEICKNIKQCHSSHNFFENILHKNVIYINNRLAII